MFEGQVFNATDEYELFQALKKQISLEQFVPDTCVVAHFNKISDTQFMIDAIFVSAVREEIFEFSGRFSDDDSFCCLDSREDIEKMEFGCRKLLALVCVTEVSCWIEYYDDALGNPRYHQWILESAAKGFQAAVKKIS